MAQIRKYIGIGLAAICLGLTACAAPSGTKDDYGNSVRNMVSAQTANPNAAIQNKDRQADKGDGQRGEAVIEAYRDVTPQPDNVDAGVIIDIGSPGQ